MAKLFWTLPISDGRHLMRLSIAGLICIELLFGLFSASTNIYLYYHLDRQRQRFVPAVAYNKSLSPFPISRGGGLFQLTLIKANLSDPEQLWDGTYFSSIFVSANNNSFLSWQEFELWERSLDLDSCGTNCLGFRENLIPRGGLSSSQSVIWNEIPSKLWKPSPLEVELLSKEKPSDEPETRLQINQQPSTKDTPGEPSCKERQLKSPLGADDNKNISCQVEGYGKTFASQHEYNQHMRYHTKPEKYPSCRRSFGTITHLKRHINDVHENSQKYYCTVVRYPYSQNGAQQKFFSRKDNWKRHMQDKHKMGEEELKLVSNQPRVIT